MNPPLPRQSGDSLDAAASSGVAWLTAQAVLAQAAYWALSMLVWMPMLIFTSIFYPLHWALAASAFLAVGTWWILQPTLHLNDPLVKRADAPRLFESLDDLSRKLDAPRIHEVRLTDELNAGALEQRGFLGLVGGRRTLLLGVPLLHMLSEEQVRAVIAHELGHFSRRHGSKGHWIYRVRAAWSAYLYTPEMYDDGIDRLRRWAARAFLPRFLKRSSAWSKHCEYEADALAAEAADGRYLLDGLARMEAIDQFYGSSYARALARRQLADFEPPENYWDWLKSLIMNDLHSSVVTTEASDKASRRTTLWDTHPELHERAAALGLSVPTPQWGHELSGGEKLLSQKWAKHFKRCNEEWRNARRYSWRLRHLHLNRLVAENAAQKNAESCSVLDRCVLKDELEQSSESLSALETLAREQGDEIAQFQWGLALLKRRDDLGVEKIREAIRKDRRLALQGYEAILQHVTRYDSLEKRREYEVRLALAWKRVSLGDDISLDIYVQRAELAAPPAHWAALINVALADSRDIDGMWVVSSDMPAVEGELPRRLHAAFLRQQPLSEEGEEASHEEFDIQIRSYLMALVPPTDLVLVDTWFTTEAISPKLLDRLTTLPGSEIMAPRTPFKRDVVCIDSL